MGFFSSLGNFAKGAWRGLGDVANKAGRWIGEHAKPVINTIHTISKGVNDFMNSSIGKTIGSVAESIPIVSNIWDGTKKISKYASDSTRFLKKHEKNIDKVATSLQRMKKQNPKQFYDSNKGDINNLIGKVKNGGIPRFY